MSIPFTDKMALSSAGSATARNSRSGEPLVDADKDRDNKKDAAMSSLPSPPPPPQSGASHPPTRRRLLLLLAIVVAFVAFTIALLRLADMRAQSPLQVLFGGAGFGLLFLANHHPATAQFNNPPGVDIWCGKAYRPENASFNPGGWLDEPPRSSSPLLDLRVYPRMNVYIAGEDQASFIVDAAISYTNGFPWSNATGAARLKPHSDSSPTLSIDISITGSGQELISGKTVSVGSSSTELAFALGSLAPRFEPYNVTLKGSADGNQTFTTTTEFYLLPARNESGSVAKLDKLYGGLHVQDYLSNSTTWSAILPYSYYVSWGGWLQNSTSNLDVFKSYGYNILHVVPTFDLDEFEKFMQRCDELGLWVMYDMRHTYKNSTAVTEEVNRFKNHPSLLLWYTGDEPDGNSDPLDAPKAAYDLIRTLDPYHPVSLVLNCQNFHFAEYSLGADIILSDVYPIAVNTTYSTEYHTVCNTTYGCCGCDNCDGNLADVSTRLDQFAQYTSWLGRAPKALWGVPQAFGNSQFWKRVPTGPEELAMAMLSINHNAKGIVAWIFPTDDGINAATSALATAVTKPDIANFILGAETVALEVQGVNGDAASWAVGDAILVSFVSMDYINITGEVTVTLPREAKGIKQAVFGSEGWSVEGAKLVKQGLGSLEVDILLLGLE